MKVEDAKCPPVVIGVGAVFATLLVWLVVWRLRNSFNKTGSVEFAKSVLSALALLPVL